LVCKKFLLLVTTLGAMCADFEATSAKARRRKSLAQAMKLVDNAIANLEGVSASPEGDAAPGSPVSAYRRRRSSGGLAAKMFEHAEEEGGSGGGGGRRKSMAVRRMSSLGTLAEDDGEALGAGGLLLRTLVQRCAESASSSASLSASEVAVLRLALTERAASGSRTLSGGVLPKPPTKTGSFDAASIAASVLPNSLLPPPPPGTLLLPNLRSWDFDIFAVDKSLEGGGGGGGVTVTVGCALLADAGLVDHFSLDPAKLVNFLHQVESNYVKEQPYHNHLHGLDVCQTMHFFLTTGGLGGVAEPWEKLASLLAALCHDMGHWGLNNGWLASTHDPLALTYNYVSPLESMHAAKAMSLLATPGSDILALSALDPQGAMKVRCLMVKLILGTDMANHKGDLDELNGLVATKQQEGSAAWLEGDGGEAARTVVLKAALHAADVSNPAKPWSYYMQWTDRVLQEFFHQGDLERERGLPISMGFDKTKVTCDADKARGQLGFIGFVVGPMYRALNQVHPMDLSDSALKCLASNEAAWKEVVAGSPLPPPPPPSS